MRRSRRFISACIPSYISTGAGTVMITPYISAYLFRCLGLLLTTSLTGVGYGLAVAAHVPTAQSGDEEDHASQSAEPDAEIVATA